MCGEKLAFSPVFVRELGSPPRVRGKEGDQTAARHPPGITPACAGKSLSFVIFCGSSWDHPRVCGEKLSWTLPGGLRTGSPPRVRGKVVFFCHKVVRHGITPACAGKRRRVPSPRCTRRDHPRVCGEKVRVCCYEIVSGGSPPRVRGKANSGHGSKCRYGITPACAGKSTTGAGWLLHSGDHPRVCGEKPGCITGSSGSPGSPPRVRGKVDNVRCWKADSGITPACAGKRHLPATFVPVQRDHPRVCGEKIPRPETAYNDWGSPPRVRGKAGKLLWCVIVRGITPACAGKRAPFQKMSTPGRDHPRVCGEKAQYIVVIFCPQGSPPRVRGKD